MTVAFVSASAWHDGATGLTADKVLTLPSHSTGDLILILAAWKDYAITAQVSGYTEITEYADGTTATGNGSGSMKVGAWYKVAASGSESNPTLDFSTGTGLVGEACVQVYSQSAGAWATPTFCTGNHPSGTGSTNIVMSPNLDIPNGSAIAQVVGIADDSATFTRSTTNSIKENLGTAVWNGNYVEAPATHASTTTGNDMAADAGYRLVTTGRTGATLQSGISLLSAAETGTFLDVILADQSANQLVTPTTAALVATKFAPTVTASDHQLVTPTTAALISATFAPVLREATIPTTVALVATKYVPTIVQSSSAYTAAVLVDGPIAYWRLGESAGTVAEDALTSSNDLDYTNTPTLAVASLLATDADTAVTFSRASLEYAAGGATVPAGSALGVSLEGWVKFATLTAATIYPIARWFTSSPTTETQIKYYVASNAWRYFYQDATGLRNCFSDAWTPTVGTTYHIVVAHDYVAETVSFYVDGVLLSTEDVSANGVPVTHVVNSFASIARAGSDYWDGTLDEVAFYKSVLSGARILAHYNAGSGAGPVSVTPSTAALVVTAFAPTISTSDHQLVTPTTKAAVLATFAPTVTASDVQLVTPTTKALTLATFAPVVSTPERATPSTVSLATATFAPSISVSDNQAVIPTTRALTLTTFTPTVTATDPQLVTPTTKAATLATFAPTVTAAAHQQVTPSTAALTLQAFAPSVTASDQQAVTPTTKALTLAAFAPTVLTPELVTPTTKALALATFAPTVSNPDPQLVTPTTKSLTLTKFAPSVGVSDAASIVIPNAALSLTTYAPTVIQPDPQLVTPTTPALELHTFEPLVSATAHQAAIPTTAALVTARMVPTVTATANQSATPTTKALTLTAYAPQVTVNNIVVTVSIGLTLTTFAPAVTAGTNTYAFPDPASLTLTGYAPFIDLSAFKLVTPATAVLVLTTYPPTAEQHSITPLPTPIYGFAVIATGPGAGVGSANGGATVTTSEGGSTAVSSSGPSARVTIR